MAARARTWACPLLARPRTAKSAAAQRNIPQRKAFESYRGTAMATPRDHIGGEPIMAKPSVCAGLGVIFCRDGRAARSLPYPTDEQASRTTKVVLAAAHLQEPRPRALRPAVAGASGSFCAAQGPGHLFSGVFPL